LFSTAAVAIRLAAVEIRLAKRPKSASKLGVERSIAFSMLIQTHFLLLCLVK